LGLDVDATHVAGRWIKHAYPGAPPLAPRVPPPDTRWQRGDVVDALYLAADEQTAWAEWYRHLAERGLPPNQQVPRDLWSWDVDVVVADLSGASQLARVQLLTPRPGRRTWPSVSVSPAMDGQDSSRPAPPDPSISCSACSEPPPEPCQPRVRYRLHAESTSRPHHRQA
jgi:hypothetical protein